LERLRLLDSYPDAKILKRGISSQKNKKEHLILLMPVFAELVLSNEKSIKDHLRLIFIDISDSLTNAPEIEEKQGVGDSSGGEMC